MSFVLATLLILAAAGDVRILRFGMPRGGPRLARHLWRMCFALFIAAGSFFSIRERVAKILPGAIHDRADARAADPAVVWRDVLLVVEGPPPPHVASARPTRFDQGEHPVKHNRMLIITSLLSILFVTFHLADDVVRGFEPGGFKNFHGVLTLVLWLCGTLLLAERRSGYVIMLLGALLGVLVSIAHMRGAGLVGGRIAGSSGMLFWVWTLLALGVTSVFSVILSARGLWSLRRGQAR